MNRYKIKFELVQHAELIIRAANPREAFELFSGMPESVIIDNCDNYGDCWINDQSYVIENYGVEIKTGNIMQTIEQGLNFDNEEDL